MEQSRSIFRYLKIRSSRPFFKKINDWLILIQSNRFLFSIWAIIFFVPSLFWRLGCYIKLISAKKKFNTIPVISIGNLEVGGTGKTPLTIEIGKLFKDIVPQMCVVSYAKNKKSQDEPVLITKHLPTITVLHGKHRKLALFEALNGGNHLVIVDDGFQYFDINNKIDILLLDPETPTGFLIPAGRMRFPLNFLKYANMIVINRMGVRNPKYKKFLKKIEKFGKPVFEASYEPAGLTDINDNYFPLTLISGKNILLVCGIAKPGRFVRTVLNLRPSHIFLAVYPDHFDYNEKDALEIEKIFRNEKPDMVITTEKDMVKLRNFNLHFPVYALSIKIKIEPYDTFRSFLLENFSSITGKKFEL